MTIPKLSLILSFCLSSLLLGQWENFTSENSGIPYDQTYDMALDSNNSIWFTTYEGLAKFDGFSTWLVYDTSNSDIPVNNICDIAFDKNNLLWSGGGGVGFNFDGSNWNFYDYVEYNVSSLCPVDIDFADGNKPWYSTNKFIKYFSDGEWIEILHRPDVPDTYSKVTCAEIDKDNNAWFGTIAYGIFNYSQGKLSNYNLDNSGIPFNWITSLAIDSSNNIWVGTINSKIAKLNSQENEWQTFDIEINSPSKSINQIRFDKNGELWASAGLSLLHFDGSVWDTLHLDADTSTSNRPFTITDFLFNQFDNIWVITDGSSGVYKYSRNPETSVESDLTEFINIYPNPSKDNITVELGEPIFVDGFQIIDIEGKSVMERNNLQSSPLLIDLKSLHSGTYFIELKTKDGERVRKKIVKE